MLENAPVGIGSELFYFLLKKDNFNIAITLSFSTINMSNPNNLHSADGSILGFLYQIQRALIWLSSSDSETLVGVEVDDDISVRLIDGADIKTIYEQAKHSQTSKIPYADSSIDLWKTLSIWVEAVTSGRIDVTKAIFSFLTNKQLPINRLVLKLSKATTASEENRKGKNAPIIALADQLKQKAGTLPKSLSSFGQIVQNCPTDKLVQIIDKIVVLDSTYEHSIHQEKTTLKNNLSLAEDIPFDYIYQGLFGFVSDCLITQWKNRQPGWISVKAFNNQYAELLATFKKKSFFEKAVDSLPVSSTDIAKNRGKTYVEQLKKIGCTEEEIIEAIHDFVRAASERSRFAQDAEIPKQKFDLYFDDLISHWTSISRPKFRFANAADFVKIGYEVYYFSLLHKGKLNNYEPEQGYTHKGTYHYLADETRLGWHPEWEKLKDKVKK
ncbi:ABC-three component system protein [Mucilaginibacter boryungensis]|uniref:ABC-three component systems C-terminal domain-containing protein n=1 Tax=Mucilaginibacter boryungensis TaxID=768480 RepID=A0ABR9XDV3_9SPHI|nr:ABC-three component system protein [Mucilaginibacter boryungensis]MBE9665431.1 hypothetical protein [Mucilaginibacter boryungensis]